MLSAYYSKGVNLEKLFENLKIVDDDNGEFKEHLNQYDVLFLDITSFISTSENVDELVGEMQEEVIEELRESFPDCVKENVKALSKALLQISLKTGRIHSSREKWKKNRKSAQGAERYMLLTQPVPARRVGGKSPLPDCY
jgi:7-cyano-7-deazaguanine synthase in queuosine biosynthesis